MSAFKISQLLLALSLTVAFGAFGVHESVAVTPESALTLSGDDEVPPVKTNASGSGSIRLRLTKRSAAASLPPALQRQQRTSMWRQQEAMAR